MANTSRIPFIDHLRGTAVIAMFFVHSASPWLDAAGRDTPYFRETMKLSGYVAPVFMFLAGLSVYLVLARAHEKGLIAAATARAGLRRRGLQILLLGYGLHTAFWLLSGCKGDWTRIIKVDILHCIGLGLILIPWLARVGRGFNYLALAIYLALPLLSQVTFRLPLENWMPAYLAAYLAPKGALALFPLIPYAAWIALGVSYASLIRPLLGAKNREGTLAFRNLSATLIFFAVGQLSAYAFYHYGLHKMGGGQISVRGLPPVFIQKGAVVLGLFSFFHWLSRWLPAWLSKFLCLFGQQSLFAYAAHLLIIYHLAGWLLKGRLGPLSHLLAAFTLTFVMGALTIAYVRLLRPKEAGKIGLR